MYEEDIFIYLVGLLFVFTVICLLIAVADDSDSNFDNFKTDCVAQHGKYVEVNNHQACTVNGTTIKN